MVQALKSIKIMLCLQLRLQINMCKWKCSRPYKSYFDEDAISKFASGMIDDSVYCQRILERNINKPLVITERKLRF